MAINHRIYIDTGRCMIGCIIDDEGQLQIDSVSTRLDRPYVNLSANDIALRILQKCNENRYRVTRIKPSLIMPHVTDIMWKYKAAVRLIEHAVLNPNTSYGHKRLENEFFELLI